MHQVVKSSCALAVFLACSQSYGQMPDLPPDETPMSPVRAWTSGEVLDATAALDPRIAQIQKWDIAYTDGVASNRTGEKMADKIAQLIHNAGVPSGHVGVMVVNVSLGQIRRVPAGLIGNSMRYPAPLAHEYDNLLLTENTDPIYGARTPWKFWGIIEGTAWMQDFVDQLEYHVDEEYIPTPDRFMFDDEPDDFFTRSGMELNSTDFPNIVTYWTELMADDRWDTEPVPGFNGDTMEDIWYDAVYNKGVVSPTVPGTWVSSYFGGSAANEKWVTWFRGLMLQAEAGTMKEAFYDTIHATFPDAKCSDYGRSIWTDGSENGNNSWFGGDFAGATGRRLVWDGVADLQAPSFYPQVGGYFYHPSYCPDPFALTNDDNVNELDWCIYEPIGVYSSRIQRFAADACVRSFSGSRKGGYVGSNFEGTLAPWVPLPGQHYYLKGPSVTVSGCSTTAYLPFSAFGNGLFYTAPQEDVRRTLALSRARGSAEVHFWCDNKFGLSTEGIESCRLVDALENIHDSVHPHHEYSYSLLPKLLDQVWGFTYYSKSVTTGTVSGGGSSSPPSLEFAFGDPLQVTAASSDKLRTAVNATFTNSYSPIHGNPPSLRINVEAASTHDTTLRVFVRDFTNSAWDEVDLDPTANSTDVGDMPGGSPGKTKRVTGVISGTDHFGSVGEVTVRMETEGDTVAGSQYVYYDLVQVVAEDGIDFGAADLNRDGVIDCADQMLWKDIYYAATHGTPPAHLLSLADFEQDGDVDANDNSSYMTIWGIACQDECIEPELCE